MKQTKSIRPYMWKSGPDPELHLRYKQWLQQKNQAQYRGEDWQLSFQDWLTVWGTDIKNRGRHKGQLSMIRRNYLLPWTKDNAIIVTREEQSVIQHMVTKDKRRRQSAGERAL